MGNANMYFNPNIYARCVPEDLHNVANVQAGLVVGGYVHSYSYVALLGVMHYLVSLQIAGYGA